MAQIDNSGLDFLLWPNRKILSGRGHCCREIQSSTIRTRNGYRRRHRRRPPHCHHHCHRCCHCYHRRGPPCCPHRCHRRHRRHSPDCHHHCRRRHRRCPPHCHQRCRRRHCRRPRCQHHCRRHHFRRPPRRHHRCRRCCYSLTIIALGWQGWGEKRNKSSMEAEIPIERPLAFFLTSKYPDAMFDKNGHEKKSENVLGWCQRRKGRKWRKRRRELQKRLIPICHTVQHRFYVSHRLVLVDGRFLAAA